MRSLKPPKAPKQPKQVKPVKVKAPHQVKPKLPAHMKGGQHGQHTNHPASQQRLPPGALPPAPAGLPAPNTTADLYVSPNAPPAAPDQAGVQVHLEGGLTLSGISGDRGAKKSKAVSSHRTPKL
jgi:hypothetical protein